MNYNYSKDKAMSNRYDPGPEFTTLDVWHRFTPLKAVIDTADLPRVLALRVNWLASPARGSTTKFYAFAKIRSIRTGRLTTIGLHRFLMGEPVGMDVDHKDNDGLNCRRSNMQVITHRENIRRGQPPKDWAEHDQKEAALSERRKELKAIRQVVEQTGYSRQYVWMVRRGTVHNAAIFAALASAGVPSR